MVKQILYYHPKKKQIREVIALCGLRVFKFYTVLPSELANTTYACQKCLDLVFRQKSILDHQVGKKSVVESQISVVIQFFCLFVCWKA